MQTEVPIDKKIAVIGAGIVGVSVALELQRRGAKVTIFDRRAPGSETSFGNAGVIARSSLMPLNNPGLWRMLPRLASNRTTGFRYRPSYVLKNLGWAHGFLNSARKRTTDQTVAAMDALIKLSGEKHRALLRESGELDLLSESGWMFLYRSKSTFEASDRIRSYLEQYDVDHALLTGGQLGEEMPALNPIFERGLWIKDTMAVRDPQKLVESYVNLFTAAGGKIELAEVSVPKQTQGGWIVAQDGSEVFENVVLSAGPWSRRLLERLGYRVPMVMERGYHMHFGCEENRNADLSRPIYDVDGSYVLSPMTQGLRLSTGVELADLDAPASTVQIDAAERCARQAIRLGERLDKEPWMGARPTLPDSRPAIGSLPDAPGLFAAFGHQHVGLSTGTGTAILLADLIAKVKPSLNAAPFDPARHIKRVREAAL